MKKTKKKLAILKRLGSLIDEAHISQARIARQMNTSPALISRWKNGSITPSIESYEKLCRILNEDVDYLLTGVVKLDNIESPDREEMILRQQKEICDLYRKISEKDEHIISLLQKKK